jgi:hypothetical protein
VYIAAICAACLFLGDATTLFNQISKRWSLTLGFEVSAEQVVLCMRDLKLARLSRSHPL